jgi:pimeloyl-ACP methyl ester carboxylesterase
MNESTRAFSFGPFVFDLAEHRLTREGREIPLPPKAFATLRILVESHGHAVSKRDLLNAVWPDSIVEENNLAQNISLLRKILSDGLGGECIATVSKHGYRFVAPVEAASARPQPTASSTAPFEPPETHYTRSGDVNIAYQVLGEGPVDLVLVMGWLSHLEYFWTEPSFARFLRKLASFTRLILFDKRGTGLSDRVPLSGLPTLEQRMEDVHAVLEAVGSTRAAICGVSEGGPMSMLFAATYPEMTSALVMIGTYARRMRAPDYPWGLTQEARDGFLAEIEHRWGSPVGLEERAPSMAGDARFRQWWAAYLRMAASPAAALAVTKMNAEIDVRDLLCSVRVPTLVLHRTGDACLHVEEGRYVAERIPGARFVELPGADHLPFVGDQEAILGEMQRFLGGLGSRPEYDSELATVLLANRPANVEGSLWDEFQAGLRQDAGSLGGRPMELAGFGAAASFQGPARALRTACSVLDRAHAMRIPAGIGLHTGECGRVSGSLIRGPAVEIACEVARLAGAGQVLVSSTVRDLVAGSPYRFDYYTGLRLGSELGEWRIYQLRTPPEVTSLPGAAPGLRL